MKIVADRAIPFVERFFSSLGEVALLDSEDLAAPSIRDADCLLVRSTTRVDESLLGATRIKCVASATSGTDHVDLDYLQTRAIPLFDAKGCNARAVAEYVLSCLFVLSAQYGVELENKTAGIIGCGNVGGLLARLLHAIGIRTLVHDPLLRGGNFVSRALDEVLTADIISLHVPLTSAGEYPTARMVDRKFLERLRQDAIFINTARGAVAHDQALVDFARHNPASRLALDVWNNEPHIHDELFGMATLATPHIAGYSAPAKLNATRLLYEQVCRWFGAPSSADSGKSCAGEPAELALSGSDRVIDAVGKAALASYDVRADCAALDGISEVEPDKRGAFFEALRANYPLRREFAALRVVLPDDNSPLRDPLSQLGFTVVNGRLTEGMRSGQR